MRRFSLIALLALSFALGLSPACRKFKTETVPSGDVNEDIAKTEILLCGNSIIEVDEECDDGNRSSGDGCSAICRHEANKKSVIEGTQDSLTGETEAGAPGCTTQEWVKIVNREAGSVAGLTFPLSDCSYLSIGSVERTQGGILTDFWVTKIKETAEIEWSKLYGGADFDHPTHVFPASDGTGYFIAGGTMSFGSGNTDILLIKIDLTGNLLWAKAYGGDKDDELIGLIPVGDAIAMIGNMKDSSVSHGTPPIAYQLAFHRLLDADGNIIPSFKTIVRTNEEQLKQVSLDASGNIHTLTKKGRLSTVTREKSLEDCAIHLAPVVEIGDHGTTPVSFLVTEDGSHILINNVRALGAGRSDIWISKISADHREVLWSYTYGGAQSDRAIGALADHDGGFLISGTIQTPGTETSDIWLLKLNSEGAVLWSRTFGGRHDQLARSIVRTQDGGLLLSGYTDLAGDYAYDALFLKLNAEGEIAPELLPEGFEKDEFPIVAAPVVPTSYYSGRVCSWSADDEHYRIDADLPLVQTLGDELIVTPLDIE